MRHQAEVGAVEDDAFTCLECRGVELAGTGQPERVPGTGNAMPAPVAPAARSRPIARISGTGSASSGSPPTW
jgi:hypothetical protein